MTKGEKEILRHEKCHLTLSIESALDLQHVCDSQRWKKTEAVEALIEMQVRIRQVVSFIGEGVMRDGERVFYIMPPPSGGEHYIIDDQDELEDLVSWLLHQLARGPLAFRGQFMWPKGGALAALFAAIQDEEECIDAHEYFESMKKLKEPTTEKETQK